MDTAFGIVAKVQKIQKFFEKISEKINKFIADRKVYEYRFTQIKGEVQNVQVLSCNKLDAEIRAHDYCLGKDGADEVVLEKMIDGKTIWSRTFSASEIRQEREYGQII